MVQLTHICTRCATALQVCRQTLLCSPCRLGAELTRREEELIAALPTVGDGPSNAPPWSGVKLAALIARAESCECDWRSVFDPADSREGEPVGEWSVWHRGHPEQAWVRVLSAPSEREALTQSNEARLPGDVLVLPVSADPNVPERICKATAGRHNDGSARQRAAKSATVVRGRWAKRLHEGRRE